MKKEPRKRRIFTDEFKANAVNRVLLEERSVSSVAEELDLTPSALGRWVDQAKADQGTSTKGTLTSAEREELLRLRKEVHELKLEQEILKKATAFFAKQNR